MRIPICALLIVWIPAFSGFAQSIELKDVELNDNKVILRYNLLDSVAGRAFTIRLFSSRDNHLNALENVSGDIGLEVKPGPNKEIVWDAVKELGQNFTEKVSLEIRGRVFIPFIQLDQIDQYKVFKRKTRYDLTWTGGSPQNVMNFDLYKGARKVATFPNIANVGHHRFEFPVTIKPGKNYSFRISDTRNKDEVVHSEPFRIKRRIPLMLKIIPVVTIVPLAITLLASDEERPIDPPLSNPDN